MDKSIVEALRGLKREGKIMIVTTRRQYLKDTIKRYILNSVRFSSHYYSVEKGEAMKLLDPETATTDDYDAITGSPEANHLCCGECGEEVNATVQIGESPDYESSTAYICIDCLKKAVAEIENAL